MRKRTRHLNPCRIPGPNVHPSGLEHLRFLSDQFSLHIGSDEGGGNTMKKFLLGTVSLVAKSGSLLAAPRQRRRRSQITLPDRTVIELNDHTVRRIDGALVPSIDPNPCCRREPIGPCAGRFAGLAQEIQIGPVLGDIGWITHKTAATGLNA